MASRITTLLTAAGLAVLLPLGGARASAAPAPIAAHAAGTATFGIQPKPNPQERAAFSYNANGGANVRDTVVVSNFSEQPLTLHVYANDAINTSDGGFDLRPSAEAPKDAGGWVKFDDGKPFQVVPPKAKLELPFTLAVPANATPGDHAAGIVAALTMPSTDARGNRVNVEQRVGSRIYVRVAGDLKAQLSVTHASATYHGTWNPFGTGSADITYLITNTGNVRLGAAQSVHVTTPLGGTVRAEVLKDFEQLLPGNSVRVTTKVHGIVPAFSATAHIDVDPKALYGDIDPKAVGTEGTASMTPIPWPDLLVLLLVLGFGFLWLRRRRSASKAPVKPATPKADRASALT
ncbi:MAG: WxL protein peptidoglycan domain-containing protein [Catenulispora sp.]